MTMQTTPHTLWPSAWSMPLASVSIGTGSSTLTFDSATDRLAWVGQAPSALTITDVAFLTATVTTGSTLELRIETVTNGRPSGTLWGTNTNGTVVVANADDNVWKTCTLTSSASITAGQEFAIVMVNSSGTPSMGLVANTATLGNFGTAYPLQLQDTGAGTWSVVTTTPAWLIMSSSSPVYLPGLSPFSGQTETAFNSGSSPDEYAMKFVMPFKAQAIGCAISLANIAAGADFRVFLWDTGGTGNTEANALASTAVIDGDSTGSTTADGVMQFYFTSPYTLAAGTTYYLGVRAETANNLAIISSSITGTPPTDAINSSPLGSNCYVSTRAWSAINPGTVGAWTDDTAKVPMFRLVLDQMDDGASTGGMIQSRVQVGM